MQKGTCDVCSAEDKVYVLCSSLGPVSCTYCEDCAKDGFEPLFMVRGTYELIGEGVAPHVAAVKTMHQGKILSWDAVVEMEKKGEFEDG